MKTVAGAVVWALLLVGIVLVGTAKHEKPKLITHVEPPAETRVVEDQAVDQLLIAMDRYRQHYDAEVANSKTLASEVSSLNSVVDSQTEYISTLESSNRKLEQKVAELSATLEANRSKQQPIYYRQPVYYYQPAAHSNGSRGPGFLGRVFGR